MTRRMIMWSDMGFCPGVARAMRLVERTLAQFGKAFTLGPLIHNPRVVEELKARGAIPVEDISLAEGEVLILRTHGVTPETLKKAQRVAKVVVDATCPYVKRAQKAAREMAQRGRKVLVVGNPSHPEVLALLGWVGTGRAIESGSRLDQEALSERVGVVGQTTLERAFFDEVVDSIKRRSRDVEVIDTLCPVTKKRQEAARRLADRCDGIIVVGGKTSANTRRLSEIASKRKASVLHVEGPSELPSSWWKDKRTTGLIGGASTPGEAVLEVALAVAHLAESVHDEVLSLSRTSC